MAMAVNRIFQKAALTAVQTLVATDTELRLYQNDFTPDENAVVGDFTVATFSGYAAKVPTMAVGPYLNPAGNYEIQNVSVNWTPTGSTVANIIYGWYWVDGDENVIAAERFDSPRTLDGVDTSLTLLLSLQLQPNGLAGIVQPLDS